MTPAESSQAPPRQLHSPAPRRLLRRLFVAVARTSTLGDSLPLVARAAAACKAPPLWIIVCPFLLACINFSRIISYRRSQHERTDQGHPEDEIDPEHEAVPGLIGIGV